MFLNDCDYVESPESEASLIFHTFLIKVTDNIYGDELNMIKTIDKTTWALRVNELEMHAYDMTPSFSESS